jgi:hypothetical protein
VSQPYGRPWHVTRTVYAFLYILNSRAKPTCNNYINENKFVKINLEKGDAIA